MFRQSPGRNQRPKGIKIKHVLQICFLIAICFWLIYQVKHSHDKKKELDETDAKISIRTQNEAPKLGRKDLQPKVEEIAKTRKQDEEAEEEESVGEEEESKREEAQEEEEQKSEDKDEEGKGVGGDELDDQEQEKSDAEVDREDETIEEEKDGEEGDEKESEENDSEDNNGQLENETSLEDRDDEDGTAKGTHEAREELYKADDASSAVTHETQIVADENENQDSENSNVRSEMSKSANESQVNSTEKYSVDEITTNAKTEDREMIENRNPSNTTANVAVDNVASKSEDSSSSSNSTLVEQSKGHPPLVKNTTEVITGAHGSSMQNGKETQSNNASHSENVAVESKAFGDGPDLQNVSLDHGDKSSLGFNDNEGDSKLATSVNTGKTDSSSEETSKPANSIVPIMSEKSMNSSVVTEDHSDSSNAESNHTSESEKLDTDDRTGSKENDAMKTENPEEIQNDPIDSSDSSVTVRTDLETLPEIQTEATNDEDAAAE